MHADQISLLESNAKRILVLEEKVQDLLGMIKDLDENYDKLYKFMLEKSEVVRR